MSPLILSDPLKYWERKGHIFGQCYSNVDNNLVYINIPKNASNWVKENILRLNWSATNYHSHDFSQSTIFLVVLRDPVERWISGIAEYFVRYHPTIKNFPQELLEIIFDIVSLDDHTEKQSYFLHQIRKDCTYFFNCKDISRTFPSFLSNQGIENNFQDTAPVYVTDEYAAQYFYKNYFTELLNSNSRYLNKIKTHFKDDYDLISQVRFYNNDI